MENSTGCIDWFTDVTPPQWSCSKASPNPKTPSKILRHLRLYNYNPILILLFFTSSSTTSSSSPFALVSTFLRVLVFCCDLTTSCAMFWLLRRVFYVVLLTRSGFSFDVLSSTDLLLCRQVCCRLLRRNVVVTRDDVPVWPYPENFCVYWFSVEDDGVFLFTSPMLVSQYTATTDVGMSLLLYADTIDS